MAELNETPRGDRIRIAFFGLRNAGKSTLVNAFTGQSLAIVSDTPGTTTDPVSKAMEILPLGPCLVTDTAGLDDSGELGEQRIAKTLAVLDATDIAIWVSADRKSDGEGAVASQQRKTFNSACAARKVAVLEFHRGDSVDELKRKIAAIKLADPMPGLLDGLVDGVTSVLCVCPIDAAAPKGRLILPQVQLIREALDRHLSCTVCQPEELRGLLNRRIVGSDGQTLVVTDSQAFAEVKRILTPPSPTTLQPSTSNLQPSTSNLQPPTFKLTSFSILFARQKGDLAAFRDGLAAVSRLKDGDRVLIAEGCTHHRQCNDIGTVKIPKALAKLSNGKRLDLAFASGPDFPALNSLSLVVQCGGCMLTRREMLRRIAVCREAGVPIVNYGILLAAAAGASTQCGGEDAAAPIPTTLL